MKLNGRRIRGVVASIHHHVTSSWYLVPVSSRSVTLWYQLRHAQLAHVDGSCFRFEGDEKVVRAVRRRYTRLSTAS